MAEVKQTEKEGRGRFFIEENGKKIAVMTYMAAEPGVITIDHTVVDESQEGRGLGRQLMTAVTDYARKNSLKIDPVCVYANKVMEKVPEYHDLRV
jgi:uncharacterized protein